MSIVLEMTFKNDTYLNFTNLKFIPKIFNKTENKTLEKTNEKGSGKTIWIIMTIIIIFIFSDLIIYYKYKKESKTVSTP